jgi:uncharacterized protein YcaQ
MDMSEISVRVLDESEWSLYRDIRLRALAESPGSFTATLADEADRDEQFWRDRMTRSYRLLAERDQLPQGIVSLDSVCHLDAKRKPGIRRLIEAGVRRKQLVPVTFDGAGKVEHWVRPEALDNEPEPAQGLVHILSPFDPLVIQRKRLQLFFDYEHRFEAYLPKEKRVFGYLALPVLIGDEVVALVGRTSPSRADVAVLRNPHADRVP